MGGRKRLLGPSYPMGPPWGLAVSEVDHTGWSTPPPGNERRSAPFLGARSSEGARAGALTPVICSNFAASLLGAAGASLHTEAEQRMESGDSGRG